MRIRRAMNPCLPTPSLYQILAWTVWWLRNVSTNLGCRYQLGRSMTTILPETWRVGVKQQLEYLLSGGLRGWSLTFGLPSLVWAPSSAPSARRMLPSATKDTSFSWKMPIITAGGSGRLTWIPVCPRRLQLVLTLPRLHPCHFLTASSAGLKLWHWQEDQPDRAWGAGPHRPTPVRKAGAYRSGQSRVTVVSQWNSLLLYHCLSTIVLFICIICLHIVISYPYVWFIF